MLQYDLSHQAAVMNAVTNFVDYLLNIELCDTSFIYHLCKLIPAFKVFDQEGVEYCTLVSAFKEMVRLVEAGQGDLGVEEYLTQLRYREVSNLRNQLRRHRSLYLDEIRMFEGQETDNQKSFLAYVQRILKDHYKVLIVRVDLGYLKVSMSNITVQDFYNHIESVRNLLKDKNGCFKYLLGYGLALEQGVTKGYHAHLMLIYNGSERCKDWYLADEVIQKWQKITQGLGYGLNNNTPEKKKQYADRGLLGIGMIHRYQSLEERNALNVARYLTQPEKFMQRMLIKPSNKRTFFKGIYREHGRKYKINHPISAEVGIWSEQDVDDLLDEPIVI
ncbi:inovirus Gp2 family protein [Acinetobacter sp. YH16042]|uniref:inovirus Gp2 family protein n=1 Tax=Acinetobacter sp. YH16042 TaxID=2601186 RepID=UPI00211E7278|nr:inovirus Gp2 family protein [Acinetobacter sp. YH16042]